MSYLGLDLSGTNPDNLKVTKFDIRNDIAVDDGQVIVVPDGIFHLNGLEVIHVDTGKPLTRNRDYYLTYYSKHLKATYNLEGFAGVIITNKSLTGEVSIKRQQVGGGYAKYNASTIVDIVKLTNGVPGTLFWDMVVDAPAKVLPTGHNLPAENIATGYEDYVAVLHQLMNTVKQLSEQKTNLTIPIGSKVSLILDNPNMDSVFWVKNEGQTITREDYPIMFTILDVVEDTLTLPNEPLTYTRVM